MKTGRYRCYLFNALFSQRTISWSAVVVLTLKSILLFSSICSVTLAGDVKPRIEHYRPDYMVYHNLSAIQRHLERLAASHPGYMELEPGYRSRHNRSQLLLRLTNYSDTFRGLLAAEKTVSVPKVKVLLSFGEHAREFLPVESMFHLVENVTSGVLHSPGTPEFRFSQRILTQLDLFIIALVNPDGRHLVETTGNYCWRGTSTGVDLNRNFDWCFGNKGSSGNRQDEEYRGDKPFSEPETQVLLDLTRRYRFDAFVSLHSGIRRIYLPFADTGSRSRGVTPPNLPLMLDVARRMSEASRTRFTYGVAYQINQYTADGTIFDYMAGDRLIPFSFAIELWGIGDYKGARCFDLFNPRSENLRAAVADIHPIYEELFFYLINWKHKEVMHVFDSSMGVPSPVLGYVLLCTVIALTALVAVHQRYSTCLRRFPRQRVVSLRALSSTFSVMTLRA